MSEVLDLALQSRMAVSNARMNLTGSERHLYMCTTPIFVAAYGQTRFRTKGVFLCGSCNS
jgi:hypothetical protein